MLVSVMRLKGVLKELGVIKGVVLKYVNYHLDNFINISVERFILTLSSFSKACHVSIEIDFWRL